MKEQEPYSINLHSGQRLDQIPQLKPVIAEACKKIGVITLPELLGYLKIKDEGMRRYLLISEEEEAGIWDLAKNYMPEEEILEIKDFVPIERATGARDPHNAITRAYFDSAIQPRSKDNEKSSV